MGTLSSATLAIAKVDEGRDVCLMVDPCLLMKTVHTQTDPKVQLQTTNPKVQLQTTNPKVQLQLQGITPDRHIQA